jgi:hypothetical protein
MTDALDQAALASCEAAAGSQGVGRRAYMFWKLAQHVGWDQARKQMPVRSFWRYRNVLRKAGLLESTRSSLSESTHGEVVVSGPEVFQLLGQRRRVLVDIDHEFPAGELALVETVRYGRRRGGWDGWSVGFSTVHDRGSVTEMALADFLKVTGPLDVPVSTELQA